MVIELHEAVNCMSPVHDSFTESFNTKRENLLDVWFIWKIPPPMCRPNFSKILLMAKTPLQKSSSGSRTRAHRDWLESPQSKDKYLVSGVGKKEKSVMRQKDNDVVKATLEENSPFDTILNKFICLSILTALTFGGFLEMSFQSALSNYSNH